MSDAPVLSVRELETVFGNGVSTVRAVRGGL